MVTEFSLLSKENRVLDFTINRSGNIVTYSVQRIYREDLIPRDLRDFGEWLGSRYILNYRNSISVFFEILGITRLEDFIKITNCVSLKDTYWVRGVNSRKSWESVSPYKNGLNKVIAEYSFNRRVLGKNITGSPDFSTDGNFPKCWKRVDGTLYLYKAGSEGARNAGNEPYSEVYAYKVARALGINSIKYSNGVYKGKLVSKCACMTSEDLSIISFRDLYNSNICDFEKLLSGYSGANRDYIVNMLLLDYVICNVDRHYGNIALFFDPNTNIVKGFTPLFDHNLSCIPYYMPDEGLEYYINDILAKDGRKFIDLYKLIDSRYTREKLKVLRGRDFSIGCDRDKYVNDVIQYQVRRVL